MEGKHPFAVPPVADQDAPWPTALKKAFEANAGSGRPTSLRSLQRALAQREDSPQSEASWKRTFSRLKESGRTISEEKTLMIAEELGISRSALPPSRRVTTAELHDRLEELAGLVDEGFGHLAAGIARVERRLGYGDAPDEGKAP